jgi:hypothetical protein
VTGAFGDYSYEGRTLAEKERDMYGEAGPPKEFDYGDFKKAIGAIGKKVNPKLQASILQHMLTEHGARQRGWEDLQKTRMMYGSESAHMMTARSDAAYKEAQTRLNEAKLPMEKMKAISEVALHRAQIDGTNAHTALYHSMADYYKSRGLTQRMSPIMVGLEKEMGAAVSNAQKEEVYKKMMTVFKQSLMMERLMSGQPPEEEQTLGGE